MTTTAPVPVDGRHATLELPELWDAVDTAFASRNLHRVRVTGTVVRLKQGRWYTYGELAAFGNDGQAVSSLGFSIHNTTMARIRGDLAAASGTLSEGMEVRLGGVLESDRRFGRLRLAVEAIGCGIQVSDHTRNRDRLLEHLRHTGLLVRQQHFVVPDVPERIGLISSKTAAGRADFMTTLADGGYNVLVIEDDVPMSGPRTPDLLAASLQRLHEHNVELIVVARGGGAQADLSTWDHPDIANAIATCDTPVWTALGHTHDHSVADQVANRHWPTPTSVAQALLSAHTHRIRSIEEAQRLAAAETEAQRLIDIQRRRTRIAIAAAVVLCLVIAALVAVLVGVS